MASIFDRIAAGEFEPKLPYPDKVVEPVLLRKGARDLTDDEIAVLQKVRAEYEAAKAAYVTARTAYYADRNDADRRFRKALEEEHGLTDHPKAAALYAKAYERGNADGLAGIVREYDDLVDLLT